MGDIFELVVKLRGIEPEIWRRLLVPAELTLGGLHEVIQVSMGWQNSHLHDFAVGSVRFGMADVEDELFVVDETGAPLGAVANVGTTVLYRYDFGDDWEHDVVVDKVIPSGEWLLSCTDGARACPPEDCGGPPGYQRLLEALSDAAHPEHKEMRTWAGRGYDPGKFELAAVNRKLATLSKRLRRISER